MNRNAATGEISDPILIRQTLEGLSEDQAEGIIRPVNEKKLGVRFVFGDTFFHVNPPSFLLTQISEHGMQRLQSHVEILVEVFSADKRIAFQSSIMKLSQFGITVSFPTKILKAERRMAQRFKVHEDRMPFFDPGSWTVDGNDIAAPPVFGLYRPLASWAAIGDISFGGICVETRFPSLLNWIESNPTCTRSSIIFPMTKATPIGLELRWTKRIRERSHSSESGYAMQKYKMGLAYINPPREFMLEIGRFIKELQMDSAV